MLSHDRQNIIVDLVEQKGSVSIEELHERFAVSKMTLWRDLKSLEDAGRLTKVHGGAVRSTATSGEPAFESKTILRLPQKRAIARCAAEEYVSDGGIIILEGGTTVMQIVEFLSQNDVTILTNGLNTLLRAARQLPQMALIGCGGMVREPSFTFVGPDAEGFFEHVRADTLFLSATGLNLQQALTDLNPLEIAVKRAMMKAARQTVVCVDSTKIGLRSLGTVATFEEIDAIVTDADADPDFCRAMVKMNIEVRIADRVEPP